ncbi:O-antigen ligase family protein [Bacillus mycoides]|uniref:O-antigen ligase family protein n=1 Tax=Bacillus mycoides TaxID=1405 RepID=UPI001642D1DD|nr:O-antigen ligase family protein [Bacillus mycoides]
MLYVGKGVKSINVILILVLNVSTVMIASSKGPIVSLMVALILLFPYLKKNINLKIVTSSILTSCIAYFIILRTQFISNLEVLIARFENTTGDASTEERLDLYNIALDIFQENPPFGGGISCFIEGIYPHNVFLEIFS